MLFVWLIWFPATCLQKLWNPGDNPDLQNYFSCHTGADHHTDRMLLFSVGKPRSSSLKVACHVSSQAMVFMVKIFSTIVRGIQIVLEKFWIDVNYFWQNVTLDLWWAEIIWQCFVVSWVSICKSAVGYDDVKWRSELFPLFLWFMDTWNSSSTGLKPTPGGLCLTWF